VTKKVRILDDPCGRRSEANPAGAWLSAVSDVLSGLCDEPIPRPEESHRARARARACLCVCVCVRERERERDQVQQ